MNNSPTEAPAAAAAGATRYSVIKIVASVFLILLVISVCLILLQGCIVWCTGGQILRQSGEMGGFGRLSRRRNRRRIGENWPPDRPNRPPNSHKVDLASLPSFVFAKSAPNPNPVADCAVCLSEFQDGDTLRLLPNCHHSFHTACVDLWFASHSTCPLCRSPVSPHSASPASSSCPCQHSSISVS